MVSFPRQTFLFLSWVCKIFHVLPGLWTYGTSKIYIYQIWPYAEIWSFLLNSLMRAHFDHQLQVCTYLPNETLSRIDTDVEIWEREYWLIYNFKDSSIAEEWRWWCRGLWRVVSLTNWEREVQAENVGEILFQLQVTIFMLWTTKTSTKE